VEMIQKIYCIIVTYNGIQWIQRCLSSLVDNKYPVHIVVVDNASTDDTVSFIQKNFPAVKIIATGKNLGFGQANNIGIDIALGNGADYVFLLNQDAWVESDCISMLIQAHHNHPEYGIISPLHLNGNGSGLDKYFIDYFLRSSSEILISSLLLNNDDSYDVIETTFVNAAAWLVSIECIRKTGGFDPIFFHYGEDANYAQRVIFWGYKIGIYRKAKIYHDREQRISKPLTDTKAILQKEWIHFLNQACDIQQAHYRRLIFRRFLRYFLQMSANALLLRKDRIRYNLFMVKMIAVSFRRIGASRKRSMVGWL
jgi:GT2 family glycosyltransferase